MMVARGRQAHVPAFGSEPTEQVRVVIEHTDDAARFVEERVLRDAGYEVVGCGGPGELPGAACPVTLGGDCPAVAEADIVVTSFRVESRAGAEILRALRRRYPEVPLVVEAPPAAVQRYPEELEGCYVIYPLTAERLVAALAEVRGVKRRAAEWPGACV
jgi:DNA-binding NtrC family response regulator